MGDGDGGNEVMLVGLVLYKFLWALLRRICRGCCLFVQSVVLIKVYCT